MNYKIRKFFLYTKLTHCQTMIQIDNLIFEKIRILFWKFYYYYYNIVTKTIRSSLENYNFQKVKV